MNTITEPHDLSAEFRMDYAAPTPRGRRCSSWTGVGCSHAAPAGAAMGTADYWPTVSEVATLDGLEDAWRAVVTSNTQGLYNHVSDALRAVLVALFGEHTGGMIREEMADNFESWGYNLCMARQGLLD
jgi:hypothetical protein